MRTLLWSYLGQRQFPKEMSRFEIQNFFTFTDNDPGTAHSFPEEVRLGAALQLGFLRMTGTTLAAMGYVTRTFELFGQAIAVPRSRRRDSPRPLSRDTLGKRAEIEVVSPADGLLVERSG
jgi:hypothetical protein